MYKLYILLLYGLLKYMVSRALNCWDWRYFIIGLLTSICEHRVYLRYYVTARSAHRIAWLPREFAINQKKNCREHFTAENSLLRPVQKTFASQRVCCSRASNKCAARERETMEKIDCLRNPSKRKSPHHKSILNKEKWPFLPTRPFT